MFLLLRKQVMTTLLVYNIYTYNDSDSVYFVYIIRSLMHVHLKTMTYKGMYGLKVIQ